MSDTIDADSGEKRAETVRRRLYRTVEEAGDEPAERIAERLLAVGVDHLDVTNGHVERIVDGGASHEVVVSVDVGTDPVVEAGTTLDAARTFCRHTLERDTSLAISNAPADGYADDPALAATGVECYLGASIVLEGEPYGTVCFTAREGTDSFSPTERAVVELIARLLERVLRTEAFREELSARERTLAEREAELERSERKYETLVDAAPNPILLIETESGTVVEANAAAADLLDRPVAEIEGTYVGEFQHGGSEADRRALVAALAGEEDGVGGTVERLPDGRRIEIERPDGETVPVSVSVGTVDLDGRPHVQAVVRDVSDRLEREERLRLRTRAIEEASVGVTIAEAAADTALTYTNEAFDRLTGYEDGEMLGRNCRRLQGEHTDPERVAEIRAAIDAERPVTTELLNYRQDGTPFWNRLTIAPVTDADGEVTHYVGFQEDVTDRKRRDRLTALQNRVLRHNLRNDLTVVRGHAREIVDRADDGLADHAERIVDVTDGLLATGERARRLRRAADEPGEAVRIDLGELLPEVVAEVCERHPDADVAIAGSPDATVFASHRLRAALVELGVNACEHAGETPTVRYAVRTDPDDDTVEIAVTDDGPGLPAMERRVIEGGVETPTSHGQGLGLWLVNWVVTAVGGRLAATVDDGTTVTVSLRDGDADPPSRAALGLDG